MYTFVKQKSKIKPFCDRVSRNDEKVLPGHLRFEGELQLAIKTKMVILIVPPDEELSPRMAYLADISLREHTADSVLPFVISESFLTFPKVLSGCNFFQGVFDLLPLSAANINWCSQVDTVMRFFNYIINVA